MQLILSHSAYIFSKESFCDTFWNERLDKIDSINSVKTVDEIVRLLTEQYNLNLEQVTNIKTVYKDENANYYRLTCRKYEHFRIQKVYLDFENLKGKLIYWNDWDFVLQKVQEEYHLWVYVGGHADLQREVKLNQNDIKEFQRIGEAQIDYLVDNLKKHNDSTVYEKAKKENRILI